MYDQVFWINRSCNPLQKTKVGNDLLLRLNYHSSIKQNIINHFVFNVRPVANIKGNPLVMRNNSRSMLWAIKRPLSVLSGSLVDSFSGGENPGTYRWNNVVVCFILFNFILIYFYLFIYFIYLSIHLFIYLHVCLIVCLFVCLFVY